MIPLVGLPWRVSMGALVAKMRGRITRMLAAPPVLVAAFLFVASPAGAAPNIDHYANLPGAELAAISPNGRTIAMIQGAGGDNRIVTFYPLDGSKPGRFDLGPLKARGLRWVSDSRVILYVSVTHSVRLRQMYTWEFWRLLTINAETGESHYILADNESYNLMIGTADVLHPLPDEPDHILLETLNFMEYGDRTVSALKIHLDTDKTELIENGRPETSYYIADSQGDPRIRVDYVDKWDRIEVRYREAEENRHREIARFDHQDGGDAKYSVSAFSKAGDKAYAVTRGDIGRRHLVEFRFDGSFGDVAWADSLYDLGFILIDDFDQTAIGVQYIADLPQQVFFDERTADALASLKRALSAYDSVVLESHSLGGAVKLIRAMKKGAPSELFLYDGAKKQLSFVASNYPNIPASQLGAVENFDYRTADGLDIPGYLYTPPGKARRNLPLVVLPHGGPRARDSMEFDWEAQYYAALGFAVYKPNFRGSTGYGLAFRDAGNREWGGKMQDDVTDGVKKLIADGIADPSRICIVGASYGGYAALVGGGKTPELYKCVIATAPVTDILEIFKYETRYSGYYSDLLNNMRQTVGSEREDRKKMKDISPVNMAANFSAPVLLIHGKDDTVVPIEQSLSMQEALEKAGKQVTLITLDGEDHWLSTVSTRKAMLEASGAFLMKHLGQQ